MPSYAIKKEVIDALGADTSNLSAKKVFIALKARKQKLAINKLSNVSISFNSKSKIRWFRLL